MKRVVRAIARRLLPVARTIWRRLPGPIRSRLRGPTRRVRATLGLGQWTRSSAYDDALRDRHLLVPAPPTAPTVLIPAAPRTPPAAPAISVIVPAHDDATYLDTCLTSIRIQDFTEWECIVIDDASIDATVDVALRHAEEDRRIRLVRSEHNIGLAAARNVGIAAATGTYLAFLDADDFLFDGSLRVRLAAAKSDDPRVIGSWCDWLSVPEAAGLEHQTKGPGNFGVIDYETGGGENQVISTSPLVLRSVVESLGGFDPEFRTAEDFEFWTRLFRNGFRLRFAPVVGVAYRQKRASMISGDPAGHASNAMRVYDYMARSLEPAAISDLATAPYIEPLLGIPSDVSRVERLISFLTFAVLGGHEQQITRVVALFPEGLLGGSSFLLDVEGRIDVAIRRHSTRVGGVSRQERIAVDAKVRSLLATIGTTSAARTVSTPHLGHLDIARINAGPPGSTIREELPRKDAGAWDVLIAATSEDGLVELMRVGRGLAESGHRVGVLGAASGDARRRVTFEGLHRVAVPTGPCRLLITSDGNSRSIVHQSHMVVGAEPWVRVQSSPPTPVDAVLARGPWEVDALGALGVPEIVGWPSRHDRIRSSLAPRDGQMHRSRVSDYLAVSVQSTPDPGRSQLREAVDGPLLFDESFCSPVGETVVDSRVPIVSGLVAAVVSIGGLLADAAAVGTPVVVIAESASVSGGRGADLRTRLESSILNQDDALAVPEEDPLGVIVDRALLLLASDAVSADNA
ncbi:MAG: glycosyltransferase family A protein [Acidimicrobiales bacterium]|nr:glycosyltransferase family A protein [Acidimicrobiales bacterium]MDG2217488.1 glycosyltransferase family A protein [Acidimicrobiales bacterium]